MTTGKTIALTKRTFAGQVMSLLFNMLSRLVIPHSSTLAWKIPWTQEPGRLQSMGSLRVGHDSVTSLSLFTFMHWRRKCNPLQCSCLENPRDSGAWCAAVYGVTQSQTRLKRLSSSSRLVIAFLPRSKRLLISWLQSSSAMILGHLWGPIILLTPPERGINSDYVGRRTGGSGQAFKRREQSSRSSKKALQISRGWLLQAE